MTKIIPLAAACLALAACATGERTRPTDVTRYHVSEPFPPGAVAVEPAPDGTRSSLEYQLYADAVSAELGRLGFTPVGSAQGAQYVATVSFDRRVQGTVRTPPKFSIGLGGGSFGRGGGLGGGVSTGFGGKTLDVLGAQLAVQLRRRSDNAVVWEGRAQREELSGRADSQPNASALRLASALFKGFPGESGITISVP